MTIIRRLLAFINWVIRSELFCLLTTVLSIPRAIRLIPLRASFSVSKFSIAWNTVPERLGMGMGRTTDSGFGLFTSMTAPTLLFSRSRGFLTSDRLAIKREVLVINVWSTTPRFKLLCVFWISNSTSARLIPWKRWGNGNGVKYRKGFSLTISTSNITLRLWRTFSTTHFCKSSRYFFK